MFKVQHFKLQFLQHIKHNASSLQRRIGQCCTIAVYCEMEQTMNRLYEQGAKFQFSFLWYLTF
jgi:hypothetical protein